MAMNVDDEEDRSLFVDLFEVLLDVEGLGVEAFVGVSPIAVEIVSLEVGSIIAVQDSFCVDHRHEVKGVALL